MDKTLKRGANATLLNQKYILNGTDVCLFKMKESYGILYTIENTLRNYIAERMRNHYGPNWEVNAPRRMYFRHQPFSSLQFYHLENYLRVYPCFTSVDTLILTLRHLYPIRNQIAHSNEITDEQYELLVVSFERIMERIGIRL